MPGERNALFLALHSGRNMSRIIFVTENSDSGDHNPSLLKCGLYPELPKGHSVERGGVGEEFCSEKHCPRQVNINTPKSRW